MTTDGICMHTCKLAACPASLSLQAVACFRQVAEIEAECQRLEEKLNGAVSETLGIHKAEGTETNIGQRLQLNAATTLQVCWGSFGEQSLNLRDLICVSGRGFTVAVEIWKRLRRSMCVEMEAGMYGLRVNSGCVRVGLVRGVCPRHLAPFHAIMNVVRSAVQQAKALSRHPTVPTVHPLTTCNDLSPTSHKPAQLRKERVEAQAAVAWHYHRSSVKDCLINAFRNATKLPTAGVQCPERKARRRSCDDACCAREGLG